MKRILVVLVLVGVIGAGAAAWYRQRGGPDINVATAPVSRGNIVDTVGATGALQAVTTVQVGSQVSGNIQWLGADFNSIVHRGQEIARLDPSSFDAQLQQARANLGQTRANLTKAQSELERTKVQLLDAQQKYARANELSARKLLAPSDLDSAKTAVDTAQAAVNSQEATVTQARAAVSQAEASVNQAQVNRDHTVIVAPIDGIIIQRSVDVGQTVAASMQAPTLFMIAADLKEMEVLASVDEADVGRIRPGQRVTFRVDAYATETFEGTVSQVRLQPVVVQNVTTYGTLITVPNPDLKLKPGMTATVRIEVARVTNVLRVQNLALRFRPTNEMFAALGQTPPEETAAGTGRRARNGGPGAGDDNGSTEAEDQGAAAPARAPSSPGSAPARSDAPADRSATGRPGPSGQRDRDAGARSGGGSQAAGDRQARMLERFKTMTSEEQAQLIERMKARGADTSALEAVRSSPGERPAGRATAEAAGQSAAQTIDELFAPLPPIESRGRLWLFVDGQLKPVNVRLGVTDGSFTELLGGGLQEGMEVVTGITGVTSARTTGAPAGARNPLMPTRGGRGPR